MDQLYAELKPDVGTIADALFELSESLLRKLGNFVPHAAVLTDEGEVKLIGAVPDASTRSIRASGASIPYLPVADT